MSLIESLKSYGLASKGIGKRTYKENKSLYHRQNVLEKLSLRGGCTVNHSSCSGLAMCHLGHCSAVSQGAAALCPQSPARSPLLPARPAQPHPRLWAAGKMTLLTTRINAVALLEASCAFLEFCIGKGSLSHPPHLHIPLHLGISSQEPSEPVRKASCLCSPMQIPLLPIY